MLLAFVKKLIRHRERRTARHRFLAPHTRPTFEQLDSRLALAVTAAFAPATGTLSVFGDSLDNTIELSRDAAGKILVNGGAVAVLGGTATVGNTTLMQV